MERCTTSFEARKGHTEEAPPAVHYWSSIQRHWRPAVPSGRMVQRWPMGLPSNQWSPTFRYMCYLENSILQDPNTRPQLYARYADDIFVCVNDEKHLKALKSAFEECTPDFDLTYSVLTFWPRKSKYAHKRCILNLRASTQNLAALRVAVFTFWDICEKQVGCIICSQLQCAC